jgi:hypothetical protein
MCWRSTFVFVAVALCLAPPAWAQTKPAAKPPKRPGPASAARPQAETRGITNAEVIQMLKAGLSDTLIIDAIQRAPKTNFSVTPESLIELKTAGASELLLRKVMNPTAPAVPVPVVVAEPPRPVTVKIQDGTAINLIVIEEITSATAKSNDLVHLEVAEDIKVGDVVVLPKGSAATGRVLAAKPRGRLGKGGTLEFTVEYAKAPDGSNVRLRATSGQSDNRAITGAMLLGVGSLFVKGKEVIFAKGTTVNAFVDGDKEVAKQ